MGWRARWASRPYCMCCPPPPRSGTQFFDSNVLTSVKLSCSVRVRCQSSPGGRPRARAAAAAPPHEPPGGEPAARLPAARLLQRLGVQRRRRRRRRRRRPPPEALALWGTGNLPGARAPRSPARTAARLVRRGAAQRRQRAPWRARSWLCVSDSCSWFRPTPERQQRARHRLGGGGGNFWGGHQPVHAGKMPGTAARRPRALVGGGGAASGRSTARAAAPLPARCRCRPLPALRAWPTTRRARSRAHKAGRARRAARTGLRPDRPPRHRTRAAARGARSTATRRKPLASQLRTAAHRAPPRQACTMGQGWRRLTETVRRRRGSAAARREIRREPEHPPPAAPPRPAGEAEVGPDRREELPAHLQLAQ
jgi:hypothetical protein